MLGELASFVGSIAPYAAVQVPMLVALKRAHGPWHRYVLSPLVAGPMTLISGLGTAILGSGFGALGETSSIALHWALGISLGALLGYSGGKALAEDRPRGKTHQRGAVVVERCAPPERASDRGNAIRIAGRELPALDETKHFKLIGTTGTGKSTAIQEILSSALSRGDRAVIADPDGGYADRFYDPKRGDVILNPFEPRSTKWDLFAEIQSSYDVDQLARSLIPDHDGSERSWRGYARTFLAALIGQAHAGGVRDVAELYRLAMVADTSELRTLVAGTPAQPFLEQHNARMFDSIRSVTSSAIGALDYIARQDGTPFSVRSWVAESRSGVLFMPYRAGQIATLGSVISAWMRLAIFQTMDRDTAQSPEQADSRLWFVIDELDALGQIDGLKDALARLRKFGGRCIIGFQSVAQVSSTYGHGDAHTIVENCANSLIFRCSASEGGGTARFASQLIGDREVSRTIESRSHRRGEWRESVSRSEHFSVESAVLPAQIEQLPDLTGYLKTASDRDWRLVRLDATTTWAAYRQAQRECRPGAVIQRRYERE